MSDAVIGAGAVLAGVLITGGFGLVFDGRRRRWEDRRRWHDDRRRAYAELLFAARFAFAGASRGARLAAERSGAHRPVPEWEVGYSTEEVHNWMRRANEASAEVQLIASEPVRTAAAELLSIHRELGDLLKVVLLGERRPVEEVAARVDALEEQEAAARRAYWMAARVELGVDTERALPRLLARFARREPAGGDLLR